MPKFENKPKTETSTNLQLKFPRPYLDRFWNEGLQSEIPIDLPDFDKMGEKTIKRKRKEKIEYVRKSRRSPIFEGAETLFEGINLGLPKKPVVTRKPIGNTYNKPKKAETFDLGFGGKTNKKKINKKKNFWSI